MPRAGQMLRIYSPCCVAIRRHSQTTVISGRTVRVGFLMRFSGCLRSYLRSSYRDRTSRLAGGDPAYAIANGRMANYPHQAPHGRGSPILKIA